VRWGCFALFRVVSVSGKKRQKQKKQKQNKNKNKTKQTTNNHTNPTHKSFRITLNNINDTTWYKRAGCGMGKKGAKEKRHVQNKY
jgi:hypothetical protein